MNNGSHYDSGAYPPFAVTADVVVLAVDQGHLKVLLVERGGPLFRARGLYPEASSTPMRVWTRQRPVS